MNEIYTVMDSPVGELLLGGEAGSPALRRLWFVGPQVAEVAAPLLEARRRRVSGRAPATR